MKNQDLLQCYAKKTAALYLIVIFCLTLVYLLAQRKNAAVEVDKTIARHVLFITTYVLSVVPAVWLLREIIRNLNAAFRNGFCINLTVICNAILFCGILSAHIVSWIGFRNGIVSGKRCMMLFLYDLFLVDLCFYLKTSRETFVDAVRCLSVIIWISALYGVFEHFAGDRIPHLYTQTYGDRICSVYSNPIPASSIWLMGFWLPSPINRRWLDRACRLVYLAAIFFTISKNAWIGLAVSLLVYLWQAGKRFNLEKVSRKKAFLVVGIVVVCVLMAAMRNGSAFWNTILQRWTKIQTQRTFYARWNHISDTVAYLINDASVLRRLVGFGFGSSPAFIKRSPHFYGISVIDNQYITCLYEFGLISLLCLAIWAYMALARSETEDSLSRSGSMGIVAMLFPMATYEPFTWIPVTFLLLLLSSLTLSKGKIQIKRRSVLTVIALSVSVIILIKLYPLLVSWGKSVYQALDAMLSTRWIRVFLGIAAFYTVVFVMLIVLCVRRKKRRVLTAAILVFMVIIPAVCGQLVLRKADAEISPVMQEEAGILNTVTASANGHVFCEQYPWLYNRRFGKISASIFDVEDILLTDENTLVVDRGYNSTALFEKGYLFTEISDKHAIYTNDQSVIERLGSLGVCLHRYYNLERVLEENTYLEPGNYTMRLLCTPTGQVSLEKDMSKDSLSETSVKMTSIQTQAVLFTTEIDGSNWISGNDGEEETELPFVIKSAGHYQLSVTSRSNNSIVAFYRLTPEYDIHYVFDAAGRKIKAEYFTTEGEPTLNRSGVHAILYSYNKDYNTGQSYLGLSGEQILINEGYASYNIEYDSEGRAIKESWRGLDGKLVLNTSGFAIREIKYDADGNITEYHYKGVDEEPVFISTGFSSLHYEYDVSGRRIRESYYDINEAPTIVSSGVAGRSWEYDENGDAVLEHYFGVTGDAKPVIAGYSSTRFTYDPEHRIILEEYIDAEGLPYTVSGGYASVGYEYNSMGDREVLRYYDDNGNPVLTTSGYAVLQRTYDRYHQLIKEAYEDEKGNPITLPSGQSEVVYKRDGAGNIISHTYFDLNGNVTTLTEGYAGLYYEYNHRKQIISTEYLDEKGSTVTLPNGMATEKYSYDEQGNQVEVDYYDINRKPVMIRDGYAQLHRKYNQFRQVVEEWYCDETGKKIEIPGGYSDKKIDYDENGEVVKESYYDIEGMTVER